MQHGKGVNIKLFSFTGSQLSMQLLRLRIIAIPEISDKAKARREVERRILTAAVLMDDLFQGIIGSWH